MEITKREIIASISIICFMLLIGLWIHNLINQHVTDKNEMYNKAIHIESKDLFEYSMNTNVGNAFIYGDMVALKPVSYDEIDGEYMYLKKVKERYTQHTRIVSYKCGKSTCHRTEHYWTWDVVKRDYKMVDKVNFLDHEFNFNQFATPNTTHIKTIKTSPRVRYKYYGVPTELTGTIFANLKDGDIGENVKLHENLDSQATYEYLLHSGKYGLIAFWIIWLCLIGGAVYGFYYLENDWLY